MARPPRPRHPPGGPPAAQVAATSPASSVAWRSARRRATRRLRRRARVVDARRDRPGRGRERLDALEAGLRRRAARRPRGGRGLAEDAGPRASVVADLRADPPAGAARRRSPRRCELLDWLADDHFTFLGYREYDLGDARTATDPRAAGRARHRARASCAPTRASRTSRLPPAVARTGAATSELLILTKANSRSTVHRPAYLDYVGSRRSTRRRGGRRAPLPRPVLLGRLHRDGHPRSRCCGARSPACSRARASSRRATAARRCSRSSRPTRATSCSRPRSTSSPPILHAVLHLQERRQLRLFVRRDAYGRYLSCLVYLPRDRYTTQVRLQMQEILASAFGGPRRRRHRLHRAGQRVGAGPAALRRAAAPRRAASARSTSAALERGWPRPPGPGPTTSPQARLRAARRGPTAPGCCATTPTRSPRRTGRTSAPGPPSRTSRRLEAVDPDDGVGLHLYEPADAPPVSAGSRSTAPARRCRCPRCCRCSAPGRRGGRRAAVRDRAAGRRRPAPGSTTSACATTASRGERGRRRPASRRRSSRAGAAGRERRLQPAGAAAG